MKPLLCKHSVRIEILLEIINFGIVELHSENGIYMYSDNLSTGYNFFIVLILKYDERFKFI